STRRACIRPGAWLARHRPPPRHRPFHLRRLDCLAETRRDHPRARRPSERQQRLRWFVPHMQCQIERPPVNWEKRSAAEHLECFEGVLWAEMNRAPRRMPRSDLDQAHIEWTETLADVRKLRRRTRISREEHGVLWGR